ncbi:hypothetical protein OHT59_40570 [Streptomyces sp. NBC_00243]|uniref:hypothetical protein n=1 Tax=Streptomyces sp. NBC_00243 TaxID=2975688 RepID=UPI002DD9EE19|nr:hypothetical protein [Streptomyces sp. NBC_00243]WRZ24368.1 hypothetical protein OHT59_40570 [Streptomyces sp. NBC_00243]
MTTDLLVPLAALDNAEAQARDAARAMLSLVAATLRVQYPTGAHLVLYRRSDDELRYDSVRDAQGETVFQFPSHWWEIGRFPQPVPADIAALWGDEDPSDPGAVLELLRHIDAHGVLKFLPDEVMRDGEAEAERMPVGIPLEPEDAEETAPQGAPGIEYVYRVALTGLLTVTASSLEDADRQVDALYGRDLAIGFGVDGVTVEDIQVEAPARLESAGGLDAPEPDVDPVAEVRALRAQYEQRVAAQTGAVPPGHTRP